MALSGLRTFARDLGGQGTPAEEADHLGHLRRPGLSTARDASTTRQRTRSMLPQAKLRFVGASSRLLQGPAGR